MGRINRAGAAEGLHGGRRHKAIGMADQRTNHFPFKPVTEIGQHYTDLKFRDFKHGITGAMLWKAQHPDVETFYGSKHQKAGVECSQCHMPKVKDPKTGKTFTSHWQTSPKHYVKETCLTCHNAWSEKQAVYAIDSLKNRFAGKVRKAEFWLTRFVDKFEEAQNLGVDPKALEAARKERDALAGRLSNAAFVEKAKPEAVEKARADHAEKAAEAERLTVALARLG